MAAAVNYCIIAVQLTMTRFKIYLTMTAFKEYDSHYSQGVEEEDKALLSLESC